MEIGIDTFASANFKDENGELISNSQALGELLERVEYDWELFHEAGGVTDNDIKLAQGFEELLEEYG